MVDYCSSKKGANSADLTLNMGPFNCSQCMSCTDRIPCTMSGIFMAVDEKCSPILDCDTSVLSRHSKV